MRELTYYVAVSLDGRIAGPGDDFSAFPVEGDHMETVLGEYTDALPAPALTALGLEPGLERFDTVMMGWSTYAVGLPAGLASPYPHLRQVVASRSDRRATDGVPADVEVTPDPLATARELKQDDGSGIWLCGGGVLASSLVAEIDRLVLKVNPVVLGEGPSLFDHSYDVASFRLERSRSYGSGVVINELVRA